ncbi:hypothetical protein LIA77_00675 [Sarocladium implicatum]|nr:hypothetical protein LIA77_00675 [Sarocladium implicatum]
MTIPIQRPTDPDTPYEAWAHAPLLGNRNARIVTGVAAASAGVTPEMSIPACGEPLACRCMQRLHCECASS